MFLFLFCFWTIRYFVHAYKSTHIMFSKGFWQSTFKIRISTPLLSPNILLYLSPFYSSTPLTSIISLTSFSILHQQENWQVQTKILKIAAYVENWIIHPSIIHLLSPLNNFTPTKPSTDICLAIFFSEPY